jgi:hypothetical protein
MLKFSAADTEHATTAAAIRITQPGNPEGCSNPATVQAVSAPNMSTSPCAKLISWMMP